MEPELITIEPDIREALFSYLRENGFDHCVHIHTAGLGCTGPAFRLQKKEPSDRDVSQTIEGIVFSAPAKLSTKYGGYIFSKSPRGIRIRTIHKVTGGCDSCINTIEGHPCH